MRNDTIRMKLVSKLTHIQTFSSYFALKYFFFKWVVNSQIASVSEIEIKYKASTSYHSINLMPHNFIDYLTVRFKTIGAFRKLLLNWTENPTLQPHSLSEIWDLQKLCNRILIISQLFLLNFIHFWWSTEGGLVVKSGFLADFAKSEKWVWITILRSWPRFPRC